MLAFTMEPTQERARRRKRFPPGGGKLAASATLLQKNAPDSLITSVLIYAAMPDGSMRFLARVFADGPESSIKVMVPAGTKKLVVDPEQTLLTHP
jgi:hypothetical protein